MPLLAPQDIDDLILQQIPQRMAHTGVKVTILADKELAAKGWRDQIGALLGLFPCLVSQ